MLRIVKIGGHIIDEEKALTAFLGNFARLDGMRILVHGGGKIASELGKRLGISPKMHEGRRITDDATRDLVVQVYAGLINKNLVAHLQAGGTQAIGLCGADANVIKAEKRPVKEVDFGWVGDPKEVNADFLRLLLAQGYTPVIAPITHDGQGHLLNTNADTIANTLAQALSTFEEVELYYAFEQAGVMLDLKDPNSLIADLDESAYLRLKQQGAISGGMIPKLDNAFLALRHGVKRVKILRAEDLHDPKAGTTLSL
jgi:acetylglutamate kinase